ncbi:gem-associated protein 7 isoform X2 [Nerophis ophidion]|uniref:gem-associated protein 7 isoform X2 n=1 Tax=Nerophis ophidion TaxID=159077 RepID=UPI002AE030C7|nr:gem-associated protein 7 isoform X2 [Nerophis ophidion]
MATPVPVLRLPRGPEPNSRGFDPNSPRFIALCRLSITSSFPASAAASRAGADELRLEQSARAQLRERFLRCVLATSNKKVSDLHTPIGVQKEALIRCQDVISYSFDL